MGAIKTVGGIIGVLVVVSWLSKDKPSDAVSVAASVARTASASAAVAEPVTPKAPSLQCPSGYGVAGSRGCFTVDSISKKYTNMYEVRGKVISKESCENLIVTLSATDADGNVICDGNGIVTDVAGGQSEAWSGNILNCEEKPDSVSLKLSTCM